MSAKSSSYSKDGRDLGNILLLSLTTLVMVCMLYQFPRKEIFDTNWLRNGFCVSNQESSWLNSHVLSFYANAVLAAMIAYLSFIQPKDASVVQKQLLSGAIMGVLGHGLAHLHLGMSPTGMVDMRFQSDDLIPTVVSLFGFTSIFKGAMPLASMQKLIINALIATAGFTILDVEPTLNFVYGQAVIFLSITTHMLSLPAEHKETSTYMLLPYLNLLVLAVGVVESTACESFLESFGGHAVYDSTIALVIITTEIFSSHLQVPKQKSV